MSTYTSTANGMYSVKWVNIAYTGPIFNFRRSSDNATSDFYASGDGVLGTSIGGSGTSLTTWLNGATAYVVKWYDQSTVGNHATQTTNANQPSYDTSANAVYFNGSSSNYLNLPNGTVPYGNAVYTVVAKHGTLITSNNDSGILGSGVPGSNNINSFGLGSNTKYINYWWGNDLLSGNYAANNTVSWKYDGSKRYVYINGSAFSNINSSGRNSSNLNNFIGMGDTSNRNYINGRLFNIFVYSSVLSDTNRLSAESNIGVNAMVLSYTIPGSNTQIGLYLTSPNSTVNWGDGTTSTVVESGLYNLTHTYTSAGTYTILISGSLGGFGYTPGTLTSPQNIQYLTQVVSFGSLGITYCNFMNATGLTSVPNTLPSTVTNLYGLFYGCNSNTSNIVGWNVANVTNMDSMFRDNPNFSQDLGNWNVGSLVSGNNMFDNCAISISNVNSFLYSWSQQSVKTGVVIGAQNKYYSGSNGIQGYNTLVNTYGWSFPGLTLASYGGGPTIGTVSPGVNSLTVAFTGASGWTPAATYYYSFNGVDLCGQSVSVSPITIPNLTLAQYYTFYVMATNVVGKVASSSASEKPWVIGGPPTSVQATSAINAIKVSFVGSTNSNPAPTYYYSLDGGGYQFAASPTDLSFTIGGLTTSAVHTIDLRGTNAAGNTSVVSLSGQAWVVGNAPTINTVTSGTNILTVAFTGSTGGYPAPPTYYYSLNSGSTYSSITNLVTNASGGTFVILDASQAVVYGVAMKGTTIAGDTSMSNVVLKEPYILGSVPSITGVSSIYNGLVVSFNASTGGYPAPTTYYYSVNGGTYVDAGTVISPITIRGLLSPAPYSVVIKAVGLAGNTSASASASGTPYVIGTAPTISVITPGPNKLTVDFAGSIGGYPSPPTYYYSLNGGATYTAAAANVDGTGSRFVITDASRAVMYAVAMKGTTIAGDTSMSNVFYAEPYVVGTPPIIYDVSSGVNSLVVSFMASLFGNPAPTTYYYSIDGVNYHDMKTTASPFVIDGLYEYGPYGVSVTAYNLAGYTPPSNTYYGMAYVSGDGPVINRVEPNYNSLNVVFSNPTSYPAATEYYYSIDGINYTQIAESPILITNLENGTTYVIYMYSVNPAGQSPITTYSAKTLSLVTFYTTTMNPSYNSNAPIFVGPQPKNNLTTNANTNQTAKSSTFKYSQYVRGAAGSRR